MWRAMLTGLLVVWAALPTTAQELTRWDFETGDLQGWQVVSGDVGRQPSSQDDDRWGGNFDKQGKWFLGTYEDGGDARVGELRSPVFTIQADRMGLRVGGGSNQDRTFVALVLVEGDREVARAAGRNQEVMRQVSWDTSALKGQKAYVRVVDAEEGGWGHVNVDEVRELGPAEIAELDRQERLRLAEIQRRREAAEGRYQEWRKSVWADTTPTIYEGKAREAVTMPLGGLGAGNIAICGDGALRQWQIVNRVNSRAQVPYGFLAVSAQAPGQARVSRVLQTAPVDDLPTVQDCAFLGEYPLARVSYRDEALPVQVQVEAFSSLIPMNAADSGMPMIYFLATATNPGTAAVQTSLMMSLQNCVGWDGYAGIDGVRYDGYGGNVNLPVRSAGYTGVSLRNPQVDPAAKTAGSLALLCLEPGASLATQWDDSRKLWADFEGNGRLDNRGSLNPSASGRTYNTALASAFTLQPGQTVTIPFILAWHFPNRYAEYDQNLSTYRLGNNYNNRFSDALAVARYAAEHYPELRDGTRLFHDTFYDSNLPYWLVDCVSSQISTLCSQTALWIEDGSFHAFEGTGCCPMNCTHVWNYEQTLSRLWPEVERNVRHTDLYVQQDESGFVHHRTVLPLSLPRGSGPFADGHLSTISKAYREHLMSADASWLRENWPRIKKAMDWALEAYDGDGNGVLEGEQWNTYDCSVWGPNTFIGTQWLAALRASEEMARLMGEPETAARYRERFEKGSAAMDRDLWNGEWWIQDVDLAAHPNYQYGIGCHADQLMGQWWANLNGLGYTLPQAHVRTALSSIFRYDFQKSFEGFGQQPRVFCAEDDMGLLICTWPKGGRPEGQVTLYSDEVWTGIEYEVAALMLHEGLVDEAYQIIKAARDRYDGRVKPSGNGYDGRMRSPWNEIECGEHYARAMSSYSLLMAAEGYAYDGPAGVMTFAPKVQPRDIRAFFSVAEGWGTFAQTRARGSQTDTVSLAYGRLRLGELRLGLPTARENSAVKATLRLRGQESAAPVVVEGGLARVKLPAGIELAAGESVQVQLSW